MLNKIQTADTLHLIQCSIGTETYGLDMSWARSIQRSDRLRFASEAEVEDAAAGFIGWLPGNKEDIPVFSLANRLGRPALPAKSDALQRVIVLPSPLPPTGGKDKQEQLWALLVDRVSQVMQVTGDHFFPLPPIVINPDTNYFEGIIRLEKDLILFLSPVWLYPDISTNAGEFQSSSSELQGSSFESQIPRKKNVPKSRTTPSPSKIARIMIFSTRQTESDEPALSFGLSITQVTEVLRPRPLIPVPTAPPFVLGLINWRDRPVPIIDLDARLGSTSSPKSPANGYSRLMIARSVGRDAFVGFPIQPAVRTLPLPLPHHASTQTLPIDQTLVRGVVELEDETLALPDIQRILDVSPHILHL